MPDPDAARERRRSPCALRSDDAEFYRANAERLRRRIEWRVQWASRDQIEDACATAWLILLRVRPRRETAFAWLVVVAERETWRLIRNDRWHAPLVPETAPNRDADDHPLEPFDAPAGERDPLTDLCARERLREVAAALSDRQREAIGLLAAGFSYDEIAALTGATHRTVDRQIRRGKRRLDPLRTPLSA
jgi:RNA polymerase sigma factor (sigma-70 family)